MPFFIGDSFNSRTSVSKTDYKRATRLSPAIYGEAGVKVAQKIVALWVVGSIPLFPTIDTSESNDAEKEMREEGTMH